VAQQNTAKKNPSRVVVVTNDSLPLHCPSSESSSWAEHPKVYLPLDKTDEVLCPYCGTLYQLKK